MDPYREDGSELELEVEAWDLRLRNTGRVNDKDT